MLFQYLILNNIPTNATSSKFSVYGHKEINVLSNHFFPNEEENKDTFIDKWESFKFDLFLLKKMGFERKLVKK